MNPESGNNPLSDDSIGDEIENRMVSEESFHEISCEEYLFWASLELDGMVLPEIQRKGYESHFESCSLCREEWNGLLELDRITSKMAFLLSQASFQKGRESLDPRILKLAASSRDGKYFLFKILPFFAGLAATVLFFMGVFFLEFQQMGISKQKHKTELNRSSQSFSHVSKNPQIQKPLFSSSLERKKESLFIYEFPCDSFLLEAKAKTLFPLSENLMVEVPKGSQIRFFKDGKIFVVKGSLRIRNKGGSSSNSKIYTEGATLHLLERGELLICKKDTQKGTDILALQGKIILSTPQKEVSLTPGTQLSLKKGEKPQFQFHLPSHSPLLDLAYRVLQARAYQKAVQKIQKSLSQAKWQGDSSASSFTLEEWARKFNHLRRKPPFLVILSKVSQAFSLSGISSQYEFIQKLCFKAGLLAFYTPSLVFLGTPKDLDLYKKQNFSYLQNPKSPLWFEKWRLEKLKGIGGKQSLEELVRDLHEKYGLKIYYPSSLPASKILIHLPSSFTLQKLLESLKKEAAVQGVPLPEIPRTICLLPLSSSHSKNSSSFSFGRKQILKEWQSLNIQILGKIWTKKKLEILLTWKNGRSLLKEGDTVGGARILKIQKKKIFFIYKGHL
ncbi:MAG: hypothetical protein D6785_11480, partial [Planctomycetota bacterium]